MPTYQVETEKMPDHYIERDGRSIAVSPIVIEHGCVPVRVVLWQKKNGEFIVHTQRFDEGGETSFVNGSYFQEKDVECAVEEYNKRVSQIMVATHWKSKYINPDSKEE